MAIGNEGQKDDFGFEQIVEHNRSAESVSPETVRIECGNSGIQVRKRGAYVTQGCLTNPDTGHSVDVFYSDNDLTNPKLSASHVMSPAGPYDGPGGQHGFARWMDYETVSMKVDNEDNRLIVASQRFPGKSYIEKEFLLLPEAIVTNTSLHNGTDGMVETSLGEHLYFNLEDGDLNGLRLDGLTISDLLAFNDAEGYISEGNALYWGYFQNEIGADFPGGYSLKIGARYTSSDGVESATDVGLLIWQRPGTKSVCLEPVVGFIDGAVNNLVKMPAGGVLSLKTYTALHSTIDDVADSLS